MMDYSKNLIYANSSIKAAMQKLNEVPNTLTLFVLNDGQKLIGTITDGDIRRGILQELSLEELLPSFMNKNFRFLEQYNYSLNEVKQIKASGVKLLPLLDKEGKIIKIIDLQNKRSLLPIDAVIMAGGMGVRMRPLTLETPKPLLKVNGKPIVEYNVERLSQFGVHNLTFSIRYLGEQIMDYFGDGSSRQLNIRYIKEEKALGTIGALKQIDEFFHDHILVMNSDILTNIEFEDMFSLLVEEDADIVVATAPYQVKVPYGVVETKDDCITGLIEKPTYTYYSNAGIYMLKKSCIANIPDDIHFNATDLIEKVISQKGKVMNYPILGYWLDIGKPEDFAKAQKEVQQIPF